MQTYKLVTIKHSGGSTERTVLREHAAMDGRVADADAITVTISNNQLNAISNHNNFAPNDTIRARWSGHHPINESNGRTA